MKKIFALLFSIIFISNFSYAQNYWATITSDGFGHPSSSSTPVLKSFKGKIYASTMSSGDSASLYSSSTGANGSFSKIFTNGFYRSFNAIATTTSGGGYLYVGDGSYSPTKIFRTFDGINFVPYYNNSNSSIVAILPFKGVDTADNIYNILNTSSGSIIERSMYNTNDPDNNVAEWTQVYNSSTSLSAACIFQSTIFIANNNMNLYKSSTGTTFSPLTYTPPTTPSGNNYRISAIAGFGASTMFIGTWNYTDGAELWKSTNSGLNWTLVSKKSNFVKVTSITEHNGELWVTWEGNSTGQKALVQRSTDGTNFLSSLHSNFGNTSNRGTYGNTELFNGQIYYTSISQSGIEEYLVRTCLNPPTINLGNDTTVCAGNSVTFSAPSGYSYYWNNQGTTQNITVSQDGTYSCVITINGCSNIDSVNFKTNPLPTVNRVLPSTYPQTICIGNNLAIQTSCNSNLRDMQPPQSKPTNLNIPMGPAVSDQINITGFFEPANATIEWVRIDSLYFPNNSNLQVRLVAPDNSFSTLINQTNCYGANFIGTTFKDNSPNDIIFGFPPYYNEFKPQTGFTNLNGPTNGPWKLEIQNSSTFQTGVLKGWTIAFSKADTLITYSWTPTSGINPTSGNYLFSANLNTNINPTKTTDYVLTTTNSKSCTSTDTFKIIVPSLKINQNDTTICNGSSFTLTATPSSGSGSTILWYEIGGGSAGTGTSINVTPTGIKSYYCSDYIMGCFVYDTITIKENPILSVTSNSPINICSGLTDTLKAIATGGTPPYTFVWDDGVNPISGQELIVNSSASYTLTVTDSVNCTSGNAAYVYVTPSTDLVVFVNSPNGPVTSGTLVVYKDTSKTTTKYSLDTAAILSNGIGGYYTFNNFQSGNYWIKIYPDTSIAGGFSDIIPTYYGDQFQWDSVKTNWIAFHGCSQIDSFTINAIKVPGIGGNPGPGHLRGIITETFGFQKSPGEPIPGADVKVGRKPPGGNIMVVGTTDGSGWFDFPGMPLNIPGEKYAIYVDIPGYGLDSAREVTIDLANLNHLQLNYYVDSNTIWMDTSYHSGLNILNNQLTTNNLQIFPNPSNGNVLLKYTTNTNSDVILSLYNIAGVKIEELVNKKQIAGEHQLNLKLENKYAPGLYFIILTAENKTSISRMIIMK